MKRALILLAFFSMACSTEYERTEDISLSPVVLSREIDLFTAAADWGLCADLVDVKVESKAPTHVILINGRALAEGDLLQTQRPGPWPMTVEGTGSSQIILMSRNCEKTQTVSVFTK